jgi:uncharacterized protein YkwD
MIVKMLFCASALMLGATQATEQTTSPKAERQAEQKADPKPAAAVKPEEKVIDGIRLRTIEANIVSCTNQERARYGLPPLEVDKEPMGTAREHAEWMTQNQAMVHTSRPVAENIAMGQPDSSEAVQAWMNSSGHRANILNPGHRRIGVAAFRTASGVIYWCQQFRR